MKNKLMLIIIIVFTVCIFIGIIIYLKNLNISKIKEDKNTMKTYVNISQEEAKEYMNNNTDYTLLDVRTEEEYDTGHIKGAICVPNETIGDKISELLTDKTTTILVYCRSGNRSKQAAKKLADLGYTDIREFGGIMTWEYETEK